MTQLSFFSAEVSDPSPDDLAGLLAASGRGTLGGAERTLARVSIVVADGWRRDGLVADITAAGVTCRPASTTGSGGIGVATTMTSVLAPLVGSWTSGAVKSVPHGWIPTVRALRLWAIAAGHGEPDRFVFDLDPHAPDTHADLATALMRMGVAPTLVATHRAAPGLRILGRRRLARLAEMVGKPPVGAPGGTWPGGC